MKRKSGEGEEARGRKCAAAPTLASAAMQPCRLLCFTRLTVGSRLDGFSFFLFDFRGVQKKFGANCGLADAWPVLWFSGSVV